MDSDPKNDSAGKKKYELSFLVKSENDVREVLKLLAQHQAEILGERPLKKLNLAYEINRVPQAYFGSINFTGAPADAKSLERDLGANAAVLRALIVKLPKEKIAPIATGEFRAPAKPLAPRRPPRVEMPQQPKPLSNEAIEKKIEEILQ